MTAIFTIYIKHRSVYKQWSKTFDDRNQIDLYIDKLKQKQYDFRYISIDKQVILNNL
jgi:hypothetical protein